MAKQKNNKKEFTKEVVILDSVVVKRIISEGRKITFVEIEGDRLFDQLDFGENHPIKTGLDESGYPVKYSVRFTEASNINKDKLDEGIYEFVSANIWIDDRPDKDGNIKNILRIGECNSYKCYYSFANKK